MPSLFINTDLSRLNAQRNLYSNVSRLEGALSKLRSGSSLSEAKTRADAAAQKVSDNREADFKAKREKNIADVVALYGPEALGPTEPSAAASSTNGPKEPAQIAKAYEVVAAQAIQSTAESKASSTTINTAA